MDNSLLRIKIQERLNKLGSFDYDSLECWQIVEAVNKYQLGWVRNQLAGKNAQKEGDEGSTQLIDDLQVLLINEPFNLGITRATVAQNFYRSTAYPENYCRQKSITAMARKACCDSRRMLCFGVEVADIELLLRDPEKKPSFEWGETLFTLSSNIFNIYVDEFELDTASLIYYRNPVPVQFKGCEAPNGVVSQEDVTLEFTDGICEIIVDGAAAILAGDIENAFQVQRQTAAAQQGT